MNVEQEIWDDFKSLSDSGLSDRLSYSTAKAHYGLSYQDNTGLINSGINKKLQYDEDYKINKFLLTSDYKNVNWGELIKLYPSHTNIELPVTRYKIAKFRTRKERIEIDSIVLNDWENKKGELFLKIPTEKYAKDYLIDIRWGGNPICPECSYTRIYSINDISRPFRCSKCQYKFSEKIGTIFQSSKLELLKWYEAMYLLTSLKTRKISTPQLAKALSITQLTAWKMSTKIKSKVDDEFITKIKTGLFKKV